MFRQPALRTHAAVSERLDQDYLDFKRPKIFFLRPGSPSHALSQLYPLGLSIERASICSLHQRQRWWGR